MSDVFNNMNDKKYANVTLFFGFTKFCRNYF